MTRSVFSTAKQRRWLLVSDTPRDAPYWAKPVGRLAVGQVPTGAISLNVSGRRVAGPVQGFGQMWLKTYRLRLEGSGATPVAVVSVWKEPPAPVAACRSTSPRQIASFQLLL